MPLSGRWWVAQFPFSTSLEDLVEPFRTNAKSFVTALRTAGATVQINETYRPPKRAYLMHYCVLIARNGLNPENVPSMQGVDIQWVHRDPRGNVDILASRRGAQEMASGYGFVYPPALNSRHTAHAAVDMNISWQGDLTIMQADGKTSTIIKSEPRSGNNTDLHTVGEGYCVYHRVVGDKVHWSDNGH